MTSSKYQARVKEYLKDNDKIVGIIGKSVVSDIRTTIRSMEYADEVMDFLKRYNSEDGHSANQGVVSKKAFYSKSLDKGDHIGSFLANVYDDGQKLKLSEDEIIEFLLSKGTLPDNWRSFLDGIKCNNQYRKNWFNLREAIIDHGTTNA